MSTQPKISALDTKMGFDLLEFGPERTVGRIPVEGNTQPMGLLHGGANCVLAETVASIAAASYGEQTGRTAVGAELNATHHRSARSGFVTATAAAVHLGGRTATYEVIIVDDDDVRICTARVTCQLITPKA